MPEGRGRRKVCDLVVTRLRLIVGVEAIRLQGVAVKAAPNLMQLPQTLASNLASNAFQC